MDEPEATPTPATARVADDDLTAVGRDLSAVALRGPNGLGALRHYPDVARHTLRLILDSALLAVPAAPEPFPAPWLASRHAMHFFMHEFGYTPRRALADVVAGLLPRPGAFDPRPIWALFWALIKAEHEFLFRFVRFWSHEERLTGHLVSQLVDRVEEFGGHWGTLSEAYVRDGRRPRCNIAYFDTATARQEKQTGADLGLVIHGQYAPGAEFFKVARFQAKKATASGKATIDLGQVPPLIATPRLGYYLFYHELRGDGGTPTPTVREAEDFKDLAEGDAEPPSERDTVDALSEGWDFASFLVFALADPTSDYGVVRPSARDAVGTLFGYQKNLQNPSRVLVLTLGSPDPVDWDNLTREWTTTRG